MLEKRLEPVPKELTTVSTIEPFQNDGDKWVYADSKTGSNNHWGSFRFICTQEEQGQFSSFISPSRTSLMFVDSLAAPYGTQGHALTDSGSQFVSKIFASDCHNLNVKNITRTFYRTYTNVHVKKFF